MNRDTIIGFVLIGLVIVVFTWLNKPTPEQIEARRVQDSIARVEQAKQIEELNKQTEATASMSIADVPDSLRTSVYGVFADAMVGSDDATTLQNEVIELQIRNKGGRVAYARLKDYDNYEGAPLILFDNDDSKLDFTLVTADNRVINTADMYFVPVNGSDPNVLTMRLNAGQNAYLDFIYTIQPNSYMVDFSIKGTGLNGVLSPSTSSLPMTWQQKIRQQEKGRKFEDRYAQMYYRDLTNEKVKYLSETKAESKNVEDNVQWIAFKDMYFSTILVAGKDGFKGAELDSRPLPETDIFLKDYKAKTEVPFDLKGQEATNLRYYFGPNLFPLLQSYDDGVAKADRLDLEKIVPLGWGIFRWVNQYFVIPLFNFLGKFISSYGLLIFILTVIVKLVLFPLTRKSYLSSAKMRVLRPQVEEINAKYPGDNNAMERQRATMDLYSRAGASPMSGCLPMLLQMPVLVALFMFFPTAIELRHQSFLWAHDLSTYDAIVSWNTYIPIITPYFGNHISLFCLLMTITNIVYSKYNAELTNTGQQQMAGMKAMIYLMPLMMLVFFNQYASGLTYYYFISTLITIMQTLFFRFTINEDKLLAKLEANKRKPQKKSTFMKRLEEMQKAQEAQLEVQKKQREANKRR